MKRIASLAALLVVFTFAAGGQITEEKQKFEAPTRTQKTVAELKKGALVGLMIPNQGIAFAAATMDFRPDGTLELWYCAVTLRGEQKAEGTIPSLITRVKFSRPVRKWADLGDNRIVSVTCDGTAYYVKR